MKKAHFYKNRNNGGETLPFDYTQGKLTALRAGTTLQKITYGLWEKGCYTEANRGPASYTVTI